MTQNKKRNVTHIRIRRIEQNAKEGGCIVCYVELQTMNNFNKLFEIYLYKHECLTNVFLVFFKRGKFENWRKLASC